MTKKRSTSIYVIDDAPLDNMIFKMLMKRVSGEINVDAIDNGQNAINKLTLLSETEPECLPDYIFLDLNMPEMDGWEFLTEYSRLKIDKFKKTHIYILSSSIHHEDLVKSQSNPLVEDFINKPLNLENLKTIFRAA